MENKIIELAITQPNLENWKKYELNISKEKIEKILKYRNLNSKLERINAACELEIVCYLVAEKAEDYKSLKKQIFERLKEKKYISEKLIEKKLIEKKLFDENMNVYRKFINNNMTIEEKNKFTNEIKLWIVDLFYYYKHSKNVSIKKYEVKEELMKILGKYYKENEYNSVNVFINFSKYINVHDKSSEFKNELSHLLKKYVEEINNEGTEVSVEDELFDIINDASDFELKDESQKKIKHPKNNKKILNDKNNKISEKKVKDDKILKTKEDEMEIHLKGLAKALGYRVIKFEYEQEDDKDSKIELLKELATYKKGAVLSELYNAYIDFDNVSKENLEAIINNFFTNLKLQGFEVDDKNRIGEKVSLNTKDLLSDFILTNPISEKGIIKGEIKYLPWIYKGKKVTPMVVNPLDK